MNSLQSFQSDMFLFLFFLVFLFDSVNFISRAVSQAGFGPLFSQTSPSEVCGGQGATGLGLSSDTPVLPLSLKIRQFSTLVHSYITKGIHS
jgi:hypothetical protein